MIAIGFRHVTGYTNRPGVSQSKMRPASFLVATAVNARIDHCKIRSAICRLSLLLDLMAQPEDADLLGPLVVDEIVVQWQRRPYRFVKTIAA